MPPVRSDALANGATNRRQAQPRKGRRPPADGYGGPTAVEGDPDRARAVLLPPLRDHHPAPRALPPDRSRPGGPAPAGHDPGGQVRPAPAAEPAERDLRPRGRR